MARVVQTSLEEEEYQVFKHILEQHKLSVKEGVRRAINRLVEEEVKINPRDSFFSMKALGGSGLRDLAEKHDEYLYGKKRKHAPRGSS